MTLTIFKKANDKELRALNGLAKATNDWNSGTDTEEFLSNRLETIIRTAWECGMNAETENKTWLYINTKYNDLYQTWLQKK